MASLAAIPLKATCVRHILGNPRRYGYSSPAMALQCVKMHPKTRRHVVSQLNDFARVATTVTKTIKDSLQVGAKLVPESVPRPVAQAIVAVFGAFVASFLFSSLLSIATFVLGVGGIAYIAYVYSKKDNPGLKSDASDTERSLEEARRIMEKYR